MSWKISSIGLRTGRFVSIIGPSGCGKTTLLRIIAGLEKASAGKVLLDGKELVQGTEEVGLVFQEYALFPWRTTLQNIEMGPEIKGVDKEKRRSKAMEYIKMFNLNGFENRYPTGTFRRYEAAGRHCPDLDHESTSRLDG